MQTVNCRAFCTSSSDEDMRQAGAPLPSWKSGKSLNYSANPVFFFGGSQGMGGANLKILEKCGALHDMGG